MGSLTKDLWEIILAKLPLKSITTYKLVCKQWKSMVESPFFRKLFVTHHQKSHTSWSAICEHSPKEVVAHYECEVWGLSRSLFSYISSFITEEIKTQKKQKVRILAYTDVGLILIESKKAKSKKPIYYVANPISRQCVKIPCRPVRSLGAEDALYKPGLVTRIENNVLLGYKIVLMDTNNIKTGVLSLLVYSSETGKWSFKTLRYQPYLNSMCYNHPISLKGNIYMIGFYWDYNNSGYTGEVLVSHDLYAESDQGRVTLFPEGMMDQKCVKRCTISQECLMYTNILDDWREFKLCVWRLKSWEWHLVCKIVLVTGFDYLPLAINPFDCNTMYMWSKMHGNFASVNLYKRQFGLPNKLERSSHGGTLSFPVELDQEKDRLFAPFISRFVLPHWLYKIPSSPS